MIEYKRERTTINMLEDLREDLRDIAATITRDEDIYAWGKTISAVVDITDAINLLKKGN